MGALITPLLAVLLSQAIPAPVEAAVRARAPASSRIEIRGWKGTGCEAAQAEVRGAVTGSGWIPLHLLGPGCDRWGWAQVAVFVPALIVQDATAKGKPIAAEPAERELSAGHTWLRTLPDRATAARALTRGTVLEAQHLQATGPAAGDSIVVEARLGALTVEQRGHVVACAHDRGCAQLTNGRRVEGTFVNGRLLVELR